jgi:hypothetical protein
MMDAIACGKVECFTAYAEISISLISVFKEFLKDDCPPVARAKLEGIGKGLILCSVEMASYKVQVRNEH